MIDPALDPTLRERALATSVDWRNGWLGPGPDGSVHAWPPPAAEAIGVQALHVGPLLHLTSVLEPMRREPRHASEMISEVVGGERLQGLIHRDHWWLVSGTDSYVGWVHEWVLEECTEAASPAPDFRYARPHGTLWVSDHVAGRPLWRGLPLFAVEGAPGDRGSMRLVRACTGEEGWVDASELSDPSPLPDMRALLNLVRGFVGVPYRWGGRSPLGFDCSGLVQYCAALCGVALPRDAAQQASCGELVPPDEDQWQAGDLLFFGEPADHVAFYDGKGGLLHCQGRVRRDPWSGHKLVPRLSGVRRWWGLRDSV